jgi:hypothetical protein
MADAPLSIVDEEMRKTLVHDALVLNGLSKKGSGVRVDDMMGWIVSAKQKNLSIKDPWTRSAHTTGWHRSFNAMNLRAIAARSASCRF